MSAERYYDQITGVLARIRETQIDKLRQAGEHMAEAIAADRRVYVFGSGHSVIPVQDIYPRYGSFIGFFPLYDPRLMWFNVIGPGGARELLWLERREGYAEIFLKSYPLEAGDVMLVFSHGGTNAAGIEVALEAKKKGLTVVTVSSLANAAVAKAHPFVRQTAAGGRRYSHRQLRAAGGRTGGHRDAGEGRGRVYHGGGVRRHGAGGRNRRATGRARHQARDVRFAQRGRHRAGP